MYIYLNQITSLTTLRMAINLIYNIIVKNKSKKKSQTISLLKKLTKRLKKKTIINNLELIILFVTLL